MAGQSQAQTPRLMEAAAERGDLCAAHQQLVRNCVAPRLEGRAVESFKGRLKVE